MRVGDGVFEYASMIICWKRRQIETRRGLIHAAAQASESTHERLPLRVLEILAEVDRGGRERKSPSCSTSLDG